MGDASEDQQTKETPEAGEEIEETPLEDAYVREPSPLPMSWVVRTNSWMLEEKE